MSGNLKLGFKDPLVSDLSNPHNTEERGKEEAFRYSKKLQSTAVSLRLLTDNSLKKGIPHNVKVKCRVTYLLHTIKGRLKQTTTYIFLHCRYKTYANFLNAVELSYNSDPIF